MFSDATFCKRHAKECHDEKDHFEMSLSVFE